MAMTPSGDDDVTAEATSPLARRTSTATASPAGEGTSVAPLSSPETATESATQPPAETDTPQPTNTATSLPTATPIVPGEGALIGVKMSSQVGVLLDEIPESMRDDVVERLLERPDSFWVALAERQVALTKYRLNFRGFVYPGSGRGQLPLPPEQLWEIELDPAGASLTTIQNHELVIINYNFSSTLLTDAESPFLSEPQLDMEGGIWEEPYILPVDPDQLLQRTSNACINEGGFPPNSYDSENVSTFYDYTCEANDGGLAGCHRTSLPNFSCIEALELAVGSINVSMRFERLEWDDDLANAVRLGEVTNIDAPDLKVITSDLENARIIYRYFPPSSCALVEQCVGGSGWRRLLQFDATVHNVGTETLQIGSVVSENPLNNLFVYNDCHNHFHFDFYGSFFFAGAEGTLDSKQAFCVESTGRRSNNETSPLTHPYTCRFQGIQAGWVDEYGAGLECQWIDITDLVPEDEPLDADLSFSFNPEGFICEGSPVFDAEGNVLWETTEFETLFGAAVSRPQCDYVVAWDDNNFGEVTHSIPPTGSFVTEPCDSGELGPRRNCDFTDQQETFSCEPGSNVQLSCRVPAGNPFQVLRLCETSEVLGVGVACTFLDAIASQIIEDQTTIVNFTCPFARDADESGGSYALYSAPVFGEDEAVAVSCEVR